jgi:hypothetical protein
VIVWVAFRLAASQSVGMLSRRCSSTLPVMSVSIAVSQTSPSVCAACPSPGENSAPATWIDKYCVLPVTSSQLSILPSARRGAAAACRPRRRPPATPSPSRRRTGAEGFPRPGAPGQPCVPCPAGYASRVTARRRRPARRRPGQRCYSPIAAQLDRQHGHFQHLSETRAPDGDRPGAEWPGKRWASAPWIARSASGTTKGGGSVCGPPETFEMRIRARARRSRPVVKRHRRSPVHGADRGILPVRNSYDHRMVGRPWAPSTGICAPLIQLARSDNRKATTSATSSARPMRPAGNSSAT